MSEPVGCYQFPLRASIPLLSIVTCLFYCIHSCCTLSLNVNMHGTIPYTRFTQVTYVCADPTVRYVRRRGDNVSFSDSENGTASASGCSALPTTSNTILTLSTRLLGYEYDYVGLEADLYTPYPKPLSSLATLSAR